MAVRAEEGGGGSGGGGEERDAHVALVTPVCLSFYDGGGGGHYCEVGLYLSSRSVESNIFCYSLGFLFQIHFRIESLPLCP